MSKIRELSDIVREIPDRGAQIGLGGFIINRCCMAFVEELIRQGKKEIELTSVSGNMESDLLVGAGCVKSYAYGGGSLDHFGRLSRVNEAIEQGKYGVKEFTNLAMALRFTAGTLGVPFIATKTLLGTDMLQALLDAGIIKKTGDGLKILANGKLTKKLIVKASAFSEAAKQKIEAAGGKAEVI